MRVKTWYTFWVIKNKLKTRKISSKWYKIIKVLLRYYTMRSLVSQKLSFGIFMFPPIWVSLTESMVSFSFNFAAFLPELGCIALHVYVHGWRRSKTKWCSNSLQKQNVIRSLTNQTDRRNRKGYFQIESWMYLQIESMNIKDVFHGMRVISMQEASICCFSWTVQIVIVCNQLFLHTYIDQKIFYYTLCYYFSRVKILHMKQHKIKWLS